MPSNTKNSKVVKSQIQENSEPVKVAEAEPPVKVAEVEPVEATQTGGAKKKVVKEKKPVNKPEGLEGAVEAVEAVVAVVASESEKPKPKSKAKAKAKSDDSKQEANQEETKTKVKKTIKSDKPVKVKADKQGKVDKKPKTKKGKKETGDDQQGGELVTGDEALDGVDDKNVRSFKVKLPNNENFTGRFTGLTPYQAANKALSKYFRESGEIDSEVTFSICESTRKSKRSVYTYTGKRYKLDVPVSYTIQDGRQIIKNFKNLLKKIKKSDLEVKGSVEQETETVIVGEIVV